MWCDQHGLVIIITMESRPLRKFMVVDVRVPVVAIPLIIIPIVMMK